jgi:hypothetical protein
LQSRSPKPAQSKITQPKPPKLGASELWIYFGDGVNLSVSTGDKTEEIKNGSENDREVGHIA